MIRKERRREKGVALVRGGRGADAKPRLLGNDLCFLSTCRPPGRGRRDCEEMRPCGGKSCAFHTRERVTKGIVLATRLAVRMRSPACLAETFAFSQRVALRAAEGAAAGGSAWSFFLILKDGSGTGPLCAWREGRPVSRRSRRERNTRRPKKRGGQDERGPKLPYGLGGHRSTKRGQASRAAQGSKA